jgi:hypothetical protein
MYCYLLYQIVNIFQAKFSDSFSSTLQKYLSSQIGTSKKAEIQTPLEFESCAVEILNYERLIKPESMLDHCIDNIKSHLLHSSQTEFGN